MLGNSVGIVFSSLKSRLNGQGKDLRSSIRYEIMVLLCLLWIIPVGLFHALLANLLRTPVIRTVSEAVD